MLSKQPLDGLLLDTIGAIAAILHQPITPSFSRWMILGIIFFISVVRSPIQPWIDRLSTVRDADKIVVSEQGRILEVGSRAQRLAQREFYARLHELQDSSVLLP